MKEGLVLLALSVPYAGCSRQPDPPRLPTPNELSALRELNEGLRDKYEDLEKDYSKLEEKSGKINDDNWIRSKQIKSLTLELNTRKIIAERFLVSKRIDTANHDIRILEALNKIGKYEDVLQRNGFDSILIAEGHGDLGPTEFENLRLRYERDQICWDQQTLRFDKTRRGFGLELERTKDKNAELRHELDAYKKYYQEAEVWIRERQPSKNPLRD